MHQPDEEHHRVVIHDELPVEHDDPLVARLNKVIRYVVKFLAVLMVFVIIWGIGDVFYVLYERLSAQPYFLLDLDDIFDTFGAFLAVLIAIEIFINIRLYLGSDVLPIQLVIATALMAIARKVIVLDLKEVTPVMVIGIALVTMALGITYWLISKRN